MSNSGYNGWSNRETWLINLWFSPVSVADVDCAQEQFEDAIDNCPDFLHYFINGDRIDWDELRSNMEEEEEEEKG